MKSFALSLCFILFAAAGNAGERLMKDDEGNVIVVWCNEGGCYYQPIVPDDNALLALHDFIGEGVLNAASGWLFNGEEFSAPIRTKRGFLYKHGPGGSKNYRKLVKGLKKDGFR